MMVTIENSVFGIEVKKRLLDMRKTQSELAKKIGITYQYLSEVLSENSKRNLTDEMKQKILDVLEKWETDKKYEHIAAEQKACYTNIKK